MKKRLYSGAAVGTMLCLAGLLAALDAGAASTGASPVTGARCSPVQNPDGDLLVTSDLPLHGAAAGQAKQMSAAIALVLEKASWKAGGYTIAYQSCDDSTSKAGHWDSDDLRVERQSLRSRSERRRGDRPGELRLRARSSSRTRTGPPKAPSRWSALRRPTSVSPTPGPAPQPASPGRTTRRAPGALLA